MCIENERWKKWKIMVHLIFLGSVLRYNSKRWLVVVRFHFNCLYLNLVSILLSGKSWNTINYQLYKHHGCYKVGFAPDSLGACWIASTEAVECSVSHKTDLSFAHFFRVTFQHHCYVGRSHNLTWLVNISILTLSLHL